MTRLQQSQFSCPGDLTSSKNGQGYTWSGYCEDIGNKCNAKETGKGRIERSGLTGGNQATVARLG